MGHLTPRRLRSGMPRSTLSGPAMIQCKHLLLPLLLVAAAFPGSSGAQDGLRGALTGPAAAQDEAASGKLAAPGPKLGDDQAECESLGGRDYTRTPIYVQEIAHRRATRQRNVSETTG